MSNLQVKTINLHSLEAFIKKREHTIFQPLNCKKNVFQNITKNEGATLRKIKTWNDCCV